VHSAIFYAFAGVLLCSAAMSIFSRNPVHNVLWLILAFMNGAGLMLLLGAEFLAMIVVIVYVGTVATLFLFVVMMLDIDLSTVKARLARDWALGLTVALILLAQLVLLATTSPIAPPQAKIGSVAVHQPNVEAFGALLFTRYPFLVESAGLILLVALVGAITLTLRQKRNRAAQNVLRQVSRRPSEAIVKVRPPVGEGIELESSERTLGALAHSSPPALPERSTFAEQPESEDCPATK